MPQVEQTIKEEGENAALEAGGVCYERAIDRLARAMVRMGRAAKA